MDVISPLRAPGGASAQDLVTATPEALGVQPSGGLSKASEGPSGTAVGPLHLATGSSRCVACHARA